jgi:ionotropic glutamate receptor
MQNKIAKETISVALSQPMSGVTIANQETLESDTADVMVAIEQLCSKLTSMIDANNPPDIILDSTRAGVMSDVVKTMSWTLGLPTLSTSYGEEGDIREWRDLTPAQKNYLVQIRPPGDVITDVIREVISRMNITNAAILYDNSFGKIIFQQMCYYIEVNRINFAAVMDYKYKSLLLNVPTRHIIHMIKDNDAELRQQLLKISEVDLNNFFILGSKDTVMRVMSAGNNLKLFGSKYAWFGLTKVSLK